MKKEVPIHEDGGHYDAMVDFDQDVPFYRECIEEYGEPVLELACGTGRVLLPLAEEGVDITGLDISGHRLRFAKEKAPDGLAIDLIRADMREFSFDRRFKTVIIPANSIQALISIEDYEKLFSNIHEHLEEDGRLIFDVFDPSLDILNRDPDEEFDVTEYQDPYGGGKIDIMERTDYISTEQVLDFEWYYRKDDELIETWDRQLRMLFPKEINALLRYNGFQVEKKYGGFDRSEFSQDSKSQIIIGRKK